MTQVSDARQGISGGVVVCEDGVVGLVNFARAEGPQTARETYMVPLEAWTQGLPILETMIRPLADRRLRSSATVEAVADLRVGVDGDIPIENFRSDVYLERVELQMGREAMSARRPIVVLGKPKSGKTRLAWQLLQAEQDAEVVIPRSGEPPAEFEEAGLVDRSVVLFVDDWATAPELDVSEWRRRLEAATRRAVAVVATSRDGHEWTDLQRGRDRSLAQHSLLLRLSASKEGGQDITREQGATLAAALGLEQDEFDDRFDGTPGSLALDLADMSMRYERLRDLARGDVSCGRLLDSAKVAHVAQQPAISLSICRAIAEQIRGDRPISNETWDYIVNQTISEGFGAIDPAGGSFVTYRPYLEECVSFDPETGDLEALAEILSDGEDWTGLAYLADSLEERRSLQTERVCGLAISGGAWRAYNTLGNFLSDQAGRGGDAEIAYNRAIEKGEMQARWGLALLLKDLDRHDEAIDIWHGIIAEDPEAAGNALANLGGTLADLPGREAEAEAALRKAIESGAVLANITLGNLLARQQGRESEAAQAFRDAIEVSLEEERIYWPLGQLLAKQPARVDEAEAALRRAMTAEFAFPAADLGDLLANQPGREAEAEAAYRIAIANGLDYARVGLGEMLMGDPSRLAEAESLFRVLADAGNARGYELLGELLADQPGREKEAETADRKAIDLGDPIGHMNLGFLLEGDPNRIREAEEAFRAAIDAGVDGATGALGLLLIELPGREREAEIALQASADRGQSPGFFGLGVLYDDMPGREADAERAYAEAIALGFDEGRINLGRLLARQIDRREEGCAILRVLAAEGGADAQDAQALLNELCEKTDLANENRVAPE
jgi:tetratricopeptide (TPR) repeat protein